MAGGNGGQSIDGVAGGAGGSGYQGAAGGDGSAGLQSAGQSHTGAGGGGAAGGGSGGQPGPATFVSGSGSTGFPDNGGTSSHKDGNPGGPSGGSVTIYYSGSPYTIFFGPQGGGGGYNGNGSGGSINNAGALTGGNGGLGGSGTDGTGGGGGGAGGYGAIDTGTSETGSSAVNGGDGGQGGSSDTATAGNGGDGGVGVQFTASGPVTFTNTSSITGGGGGAGGTTTSGTAGSSGAGGVGIAGSSLNVANSGTITGGKGNAGTGAQADAIDFTGGTNSLTLNTTAANGGLSGNLGLGGSVTITPDAAGTTLTSLLHDYSGTAAGSLVKSGAGTLALSVTNSYTGGTALNAGTLRLAARQAAGTGTLNFGGANTTLQVDNAALADSSYSGTVTGFLGAANEALDLSGLGYQNGATAALNGTTLTVTSNGVTDTFTNFSLASGLSAANYTFKAVKEAAGTGTEVEAVLNAPVAPTLNDDNGASSTDKITSDPAITYATPASGLTLRYSTDGTTFATLRPVFTADGPVTVYTDLQDAYGNTSGPSSPLTFTLAPTSSGLTGSLTVNQQSAATALFATAPTVSDVDPHASVVATLRLMYFSQGRLQGAGPLVNDTDYQITGTAAQVSQALANVTFTPTPGFNGSIDVGVSLSDGQIRGDTGQVAVTVRPVIVGDVSGGIYIVNDIYTAIEPGPNGANETELSSVSNAVAPGVGTLQLQEGSGAVSAVATSGNHTLIGNSADNVFVAQNGTDFMFGGAGNDIYNVDSNQDQIIEQPGGGYDSIYSSANFHLSDNVEALHLVEGSSATVALGNSGDNSLYANSNGDVLNGLGGNDTLYGGAGADTFQFSQSNFGHQTVVGFDPNKDNLSFANFVFSDYSALNGHLAQSGSDVLVLTGDPNNYVTLKNTQLSSLSAKDFSFFGSGNGMA